MLYNKSVLSQLKYSRDNFAKTVKRSICLNLSNRSLIELVQLIYTYFNIIDNCYSTGAV